MAIVIGLNSYASRAAADVYLADSLRAAVAWAALDATTKDRALITAWRLLEKQRWLGEAFGYTIVTAGSIVVGGTGYVIGDIVSVDGAGPREAQFQVLTLTGSAIATMTLIDVGLYTAEPVLAGVALNTVTGAGTGATANVTAGDQVSKWPRTGVTDCDGTAVADDEYPQNLIYAQFELAYELVASGQIESTGGIGTNIKSLQADTVSLEFFRGTSGADGAGSQRFPTSVHEYIRCYAAGGRNFGAAAFGLVSGTGAASSVADYPDDYGLNEGY